ncbi:hypothetical protein OG927_34440 (plasmid) [Streptomyces clavifer]|uniref:hypothetical protein n=1 Tax=Streptomyces clavifer TaxID=68188 RepID=UPI002E800899|nr:hypothetical protein [Streptomyces clavifer]WUC32459.1 hypothetical protein OG927_34440 [Streptomyces clavifer]
MGDGSATPGAPLLAESAALAGRRCAAHSQASVPGAAAHELFATVILARVTADTCGAWPR